MPASNEGRGGWSGLTVGLVAACVAASWTAVSCVERGDSGAPSASGGLGPGVGGHASSGGAQSGGAASGGSPAGGAAYGGASGDRVDWPGGQTSQSACPTEVGDYPAPPPVALEHGGHVLFNPLFPEGTCPDGTFPSERVQCTEIPVCSCEYPCSPACGANENCTPNSDGNVCGCHPATEGEPGDCHWTRLVESDVLDDCDAWRFTVFDNGYPVVAEVGDGVLHLASSQRCQTLFAQVVVRLPAADVFPDGVALAFDYKARGEAAQDQPAPNSVRLPWTTAGLVPSAEPAQRRLCVRLDPYPLLTELVVAIENFGLCDEVTPAELWLSNLRLEADEECL